MKSLSILILSITISILSAVDTYAQKKGKKKKKSEKEALTLDEDILESDSIPNVELELSEEELNLAKEEEKRNQRKRNKKKKKKIYLGIKTKGGFTKNATRSYTDTEVFRFIEPSYLMDDPYQQDIYYYDIKDRKIRHKDYYTIKTYLKKGKKILLLHGPYAKYRNREKREEGYFYKGTKHGKWKEYDRNFTLMEKLKYDLGHPADSKITYYDAAKTKVKEVMPIQHGRRQGKYYLFYENGVMAMEGEYENDKKVKMWREWYETRQRKKDMLYPLYWWEDKEAKLLREWNQRGQLMYDIDRGGKLNK